MDAKKKCHRKQMSRDRNGRTDGKRQICSEKEILGERVVKRKRCQERHVNTIRLTVTKIPKICHKQYLNMAMSPRKGPEKLLVLSQVLPIKSPFLWENIRPPSTEISGSGPFHCRLQWQDLKNLWIKG